MSSTDFGSSSLVAMVKRTVKEFFLNVVVSSIILSRLGFWEKNRINLFSMMPSTKKSSE